MVWDLRNPSRTTAYLTRKGTKIKGDVIVLVRQLGDLMVTGNPDGPYPGTPHPSNLYTHMAVHRVLQVQMEQMVETSRHSVNTVTGEHSTPVSAVPALSGTVEPVWFTQAKQCAICLDMVSPSVGP